MMVLAVWALIPGREGCNLALAQAPETVFGGFLESRHSIQIQSPNDTLASATMARLEMTAYWEKATLFTAADLEENHLLGEESGVSLHEGYLDLISGNLSIRTGRQIIIWGQADGIRITDNISPLDYSEYITRDFDELRLGVDAVNMNYAGDMGNLQFIWIPFYRAGVLPAGDSPWHIDTGNSRTVLPAEEPDNSLSNSEAAVKYALYLPGADLALSYFYTWADYPAYTPLADGNGDLTLQPEYYRRHIFGADFSKPFGNFVFRAEAAWFHGNKIASATQNTAPVKKDRIKWLGGLDWYPGNNWTLSAQYSRSRILNPDTDEGLAERTRQDIATLNLSKDLLREKLTLSALIYLDPDIGDSLTRLSSEYQIMDDLSIFFGSDLFFGDREGSFGQYKDNTQVWTKIKYYF
ncbi:MAG: hypothetical protein MI802_19140 [Desulfobacterales bacterium]|nr:hypothetical protein [Desulfobacterales bacterium]